MKSEQRTYESSTRTEFLKGILLFKLMLLGKQKLESDLKLNQLAGKSV